MSYYRLHFLSLPCREFGRSQYLLGYNLELYIHTTHTDKHTHTHAHAHTHTHTRTQMHTHTQTHTHTHTHTHTRTDAHTDPHPHAHTHTHIHTGTHPGSPPPTHTQNQCEKPVSCKMPQLTSVQFKIVSTCAAKPIFCLIIALLSFFSGRLSGASSFYAVNYNPWG